MAPAKALGDIVHGTASDISLAVVTVIAHAEDDFAEFRSHAEKSSEPHPEQGPIAAGQDSRRDADDISATNAAGQGTA